MNRLVLAWAVSFAILAAAPAAAAETVREFLATADSIPRNPTALLHPGMRHLLKQLRGSMAEIRAEQAGLVARGQPRTICLPEKVPVTDRSIAERFEAIPESRRGMSVTQAVREWMAERYPC